LPLVPSGRLGTSHPAVHLAICGSVAFHSPEMSQTAIDLLSSNLQVETQALLIGGSRLLGALIAGNDNGIAVADLATSEDTDVLTSYGDVVVMESGINAAGNLMVVNSHGAVVSPAIPEDGRELLQDVFGVSVSSLTVAGHSTLGSVIAANDRGALLHPDVTKEEAEQITQTLDVDAMVGTVGFGSPFVGSGLRCSNDGAVVSEQTTGPESNRIEDALFLYD